MKFIVIGAMLLAGIGIGVGHSAFSGPSDKAKAGFSQVEMGMTKSEVVSIMGKPDSGQHFETNVMGDTTTEECYYWGFSAYQLCFTDGLLDSKNDYSTTQ